MRRSGRDCLRDVSDVTKGPVGSLGGGSEKTQVEDSVWRKQGSVVNSAQRSFYPRAIH